MPRSVVLLAAVAGLAITAIGAGLWQAERQGQREAAGRDSDVDTPRVAPKVAIANDVATPETAIGPAAPGKASSETIDVDDDGAPPTLNQDADLQAAFVELLNDPDPEVRREASQLAREFAVLSGD